MLRWAEVSEIAGTGKYMRRKIPRFSEALLSDTTPRGNKHHGTKDETKLHYTY
jgi:hypothetical protein